ncbi:DUF4070 domain-containing protein [bacterium]|nr:DUF4070 domain-containing protein [bacterium]
MKIILIYPRYPDTFWSFKHALKFISKKSSYPPLGLLTVANLLPSNWEKKLVDMNISGLKDEDIQWADYAFISAMNIQKKSAQEVIQRCKEQGVRVVAGGPVFTTGHQEFKNVDHFILDEAETTLPPFLEDLQKGCPKHMYTSDQFPDIQKSPPPKWDLIDMKNYATMNIQYSRGCPYNCEFCDIIVLNGHRPRTKSKDQILKELDALYTQGWRGGVMFVDDNFIGNKKKLKRNILPALTEWRKKRKNPFNFMTEASINLADDEELMNMMVDAGFDSVFVGIETPNQESLTECNKKLNTDRDLAESVKKMHHHGLQVMGGFIVGFDHDPPSIFENQIDFIQKSGIVTAMVGLLNAPKKTRLYKRLKKENRLLRDISGDNMDFSLNFIPKMNLNTLLNGYKKVLHNIYSPKQYYQRILTFLKEYKPQTKKRVNFNFCHIQALLRSLWHLGIKGKERFCFWKLLSWTLIRRPHLFPLAITFSIYGSHFRKIVGI